MSNVSYYDGFFKIKSNKTHPYSSNATSNEKSQVNTKSRRNLKTKPQIKPKSLKRVNVSSRGRAKQRRLNSHRMSSISSPPHGSNSSFDRMLKDRKFSRGIRLMRDKQTHSAPWNSRGRKKTPCQKGMKRVGRRSNRSSSPESDKWIRMREGERKCSGGICPIKKSQYKGQNRRKTQNRGRRRTKPRSRRSIKRSRSDQNEERGRNFSNYRQISDSFSPPGRCHWYRRY